MPKPTKRLKKKRKVAKPTTVDPAVDSNGDRLIVGQRVRFDDALYTVEIIRTVERQELVYFRADAGGLSQIHLPLVTIFDDGPPPTKKTATPPAKRSVRSRLRSRRR